MKICRKLITWVLIFVLCIPAMVILKPENAEAVTFTPSGRSAVQKLSPAQLRANYKGIPAYTSLYQVDPVITGSDYHRSQLTAEAYRAAAGYINYYRSNAGLGSISLTDALNTSASYGALVLAMNNDLNHYPTQPADMSDEDFNIASSATRSSNLSYSGGFSVSSVLRVAVEGQMDDSGSNEDRVGHRRWLLNPDVLTMGVGSANNGASYYTDIRVFGSDISSSYVSDYDYISWPASGYMLTNTFYRNVPWSITLNPSKYQKPAASNVQVVLRRLSDNRGWTFNNSKSGNKAVSSLDYFTVENSGYGISNCIIFRPAYTDFSEYLGTFQVEVSGIKTLAGEDTTLNYQVEFVPLENNISTSAYSTTIENTSYRYTGSAITPAVSVRYNSTVLKEGVDYQVSYSNNTAAGTASVVITGIGTYTGSVTKTFEINDNISYINYQLDGDTESFPRQSVTNGEPSYLYAEVPTKDTYDFLGWSTSSSATTASYYPGASVTLSRDLTLYPVWNAPTTVDPTNPVKHDANITYGEQTITYKIIPQTSGNYNFESSGSFDTKAKLYDENMSYLTENDDSGIGTNFRISYDLTAHTIYYLKVQYYNSTQTGSFPVFFANAHTCSGTAVKENIHEATYTSPESYDMVTYCQYCGKEISRESFTGSVKSLVSGTTFTLDQIPSSLHFIPTKTSYYTFASNHPDADPYIYIYDGDNVVGHADDTNPNDYRQFILTVLLTAGKDYKIYFGEFSSYEGNYQVSLKECAPVLTGVSLAADGVNVTWEPMASDVVYRVYRKEPGGSYTKVGDTAAVSYKDTTAVSGKTYIYTVRAMNTAKTAFVSGYNAAGKQITYVKAPVISSVSNNTAGVNLKWAASAGAAKYRVYYKKGSGGSWTKVADTTATSYTIPASKLQGGATYYYTVRALNADASKFVSNFVSSKGYLWVPIPALSSVANGDSGVTVKWAASAGASRYRVYYKETGSSAGWTKAGDTTATSYKVASSLLTVGKTYSFTVRALSSDAKSFVSYYDTTGKSITYFTTPKLSSAVKSGTKINITWTKVAGASGYYVYRKTGSSGSYSKIGTATGTSFSDTTAKTSGTTYYYTVRAYKGSSLSGYVSAGIGCKY